MLFLRKKTIPLNEFFIDGYVDIHSHLLPGIDDGAIDLKNSIQLIERMSSYGIKNLITTPHILEGMYPNNKEIIENKLKIVKKELVKRNISDVKIDAAAEYMLDGYFLKLLEKKQILTLKNNFILIEISFFKAPLNLFDIIFQIFLNGYQPVLAHPERYMYYHKKINDYYKLKKAGCFFQLNLLSLTNLYGYGVKKTSLELLNKGLYDFVGTDAHNDKYLDSLKNISTKKNLKLIKNLLENNKKYFL